MEKKDALEYLHTIRRSFRGSSRPKQQALTMAIEALSEGSDFRANLGIGQKVRGQLIEDVGEVLSIGPAIQLQHFDESGAMTQCIADGLVGKFEPAVAVRTGNSNGVYLAWEVWANQ